MTLFSVLAAHKAAAATSGSRNAILTWLRGTLRRWLLTPVIVLSVIVALSAGFFSYRLLDDLLVQRNSELLVDVRRLQMMVLLIFGLGTIGVVALSFWLADRVIRPVQGLVRAAQSVANGQITGPVAEPKIGELALLVEAFNAITTQVQAQTSDVLQDQARQANYLFEASAELGRTLDLDDAVQTAAEAIFGLGGLSYVVIFTGRGELGPYTCRAVRGLDAETMSGMLGREYAVPLWGVMARALVSRQPLVIGDVAAEKRPRPGEFDWDVGQGTMLLFPVAGASGPSGLMIIGSPEPGTLDAGSLGDMVFALARIAARSIQNAQLYQEAVRAQEQLVTLQMISKVVASTTQIEDVLAVVVREAAEMVANSQAWLFLKDDDTGAGRLYSQARTVEVGFQNPVHQEAVTWVMQAGQPIFYDPEQPLAPAPILVHSGPAICVPVEVNDEPVGALVVVSRERRRAFVEDDMVVLRTLTNAAAAALRTAQLRQSWRPRE
jgi:GAF domain-containing protein/HAMP domain-containing protein